MTNIDAPVQEKRVTSSDGTEIAYYIVGTGDRTWLMPPAMGAPMLAYKHLLEGFARSHTIVTWDQRGFYRSGVPRDPEAMAVDDHISDMLAVIRAERLERFVLGGWSMAVQLSLEYYHRHPESVRALVLVSGPYERAVAGFAPSRAAQALALGALRAGPAMSGVLNALSRRILGAKGMSTKLAKIGILAHDTQHFADVLAEFSKVDWGRYFTMARHLHAHSAAAYLDEIRVPTLITAGTRDLLTPLTIAEKMHAKIRGSELYVVPDATHYVVAEFPELLTTRIGDFLAKVERVADAGRHPSPT